MTLRGQQVDRRLPGLFDELANASTPDYLEAAIQEASSRAQRPMWTFPGRWLPVQLTTQAAPGTRVPWRQLGILVLISLLLAAAAVAYVGSRKSTSPAPPFGLAANGAIAFERDGDIVILDQVTGDVTPITSGPEVDTAPVYARDGTRIAFERQVEGVAGRLLMVARPDGSDLVQVTPEPLAGLLQWTFAPDGRELLVASLRGGSTELTALAVDGAREPRRIEVQLPASADDVEPAAYRPPDGREVLFIGQPAGSATRGLYIFDVLSGKSRPVVEPVPDSDVFGASWSPAGDAISYGRFAVTGEGLRAHTHVVSPDGSGDRRIDPAPGLAFNGALSEWSNDGTRLVVIRGAGGGDAPATERIVRVDGGAAPIELACDASVTGGCPSDWIWSPDDSTLLGVTTDEQGVMHYHLADPVTGRITQTSWIGAGPPSWQRTTP